MRCGAPFSVLNIFIWISDRLGTQRTERKTENVYLNVSECMRMQNEKWKAHWKHMSHLKQRFLFVLDIIYPLCFIGLMLVCILSIRIIYFENKPKMTLLCAHDICRPFQNLSIHSQFLYAIGYSAYVQAALLAFTFRFPPSTLCQFKPISLLNIGCHDSSFISISSWPLILRLISRAVAHLNSP